MKNFADKVVVITGAGSGMGRAYALEFARLGAKVALNDYKAATLEETVQQVRALGAAVYHEVFDVSSREAVFAFAEQVQQNLGNAHVVINNAGVEGSTQPVWATDEAHYVRVMGINFYGVVHGTQAFLPQLRANAEGAIVNVSSIFGLIGTPNSSDYCASKFAVRGFTEALMVELQDSPVDAFLVHPGGIDTSIGSEHAESEAFRARYLTTPPEDIVRYVIASIRKKRVKIVYGRDSMKTWLASNLVPLGLLNKLIWRELKTVMDRSAYPR